jgi:hypothetical protein
MSAKALHTGACPDQRDADRRPDASSGRLSLAAIGANPERARVIRSVRRDMIHV